MRLWIDDTHPAPTGFVRVKTVNAAKAAIRCYERTFSGDDTIVISIGNDVEILKWLEETKFVDTGYFFHFHSKNTIGAKMPTKVLVIFLIEKGEKENEGLYDWSVSV